MNMDVKSLINLDAFTKGLNSTTRSLGGVIPIAVIDILESNAYRALPNVPYASNALSAGFFLWKTYTASNSLMNA